MMLAKNQHFKVYEGDKYILYNADAVSFMQTQIKDNSIDLIIADPPYFEICGDFDFGVFKTQKDYLDWCKIWLLECKRILKDNGTLILWGGVGLKPLTFARLAIMIEDGNIFCIKNWITQRNSRGVGAKTNYMSAREDFLFLTKNKNNYTFHIPYLDEKSTRKDLGANNKPRKNKFKRVSNVWTDIAEASQSSIERCTHPTVKAQKLCDRIIQTHSNENELIFIPFSGAGSEVISAVKNNRKSIACEIDEKYFNESIKRINKLLERFKSDR
ncbi:hypothetical protein IO405_000531 [Campylobacter lari]|nr:hypothetical protein [Campylobacter lari]